MVGRKRKEVMRTYEEGRGREKGRSRREEGWRKRKEKQRRRKREEGGRKEEGEIMWEEGWRKRKE